MQMPPLWSPWGRGREKGEGVGFCFILGYVGVGQVISVGEVVQLDAGGHKVVVHERDHL